jgi:hypothetical protein
LSEIATQLAMGPWYVRDEDRPFMPGFNEGILRQQITAGRITANTILRGPTTNQFWKNAADVQGVSRLMGTCHACHQPVEPTDTACQFCKADLSLPSDVDTLGLRYTTEEARADAVNAIQDGRAKAAAAPTPTPKRAKKPAAPTQPQAMKGSTVVQPDMLEPVDSAPAAEASHATEAAYEDQNELASELAEDVWNAGAAAPSRRRRRRQNNDPLVIGMSIAFLFVIAIGGFILLTSSGSSTEETEDEQVEAPKPKRDKVAVSRISVPALTVMERLSNEDIPAEFEDRYQAMQRLQRQAEADREADRYDAAYDAYAELADLAAPLEADIAQWRIDQQAKAEANELRTRTARLKEQAQDAEAERWSAKQWLAGQAAFQEADRLLASANFAEAAEKFAEAEEAYLASETQALAGQAANTARESLNEAMAEGGSEQTLRRFANEAIDTMQRLRSEADAQLNDQQYAKAEQSYNAALDALAEAQQIVELARYKKYYAFEAGFQASRLILVAARGDGVSSEAKSALSQLFDKLRLAPNPAAGITPGDDVGFTVAIQPLINDARDKLIAQHGEAVQACYQIGFHASIIDQTLKTIALTDDQQKRIHQSLRTIEDAGQQAGWDMNRLRPLIDQARTANRNAKLNQAPEATRAAWQRVLGPMQSRESAPALMEPSTSPSSDPTDPELFPTLGS